MRIREVRVIVTSPGRNFVTVKIVTDDGVTGVGDATLNGRELAVASYLRDHIAPLLIGRDAGLIEDTWQFLYKGAYWRRGPVTMTAIAAVDVALWDILGKVAGLPVYRLLGGACRDRVTVYGHANGADLPEVLDEVARFVDQDTGAVRVQAGVPGMAGTYGVTTNKSVYDPADGALPTQTVWSTERYLRHIPGVLESVRDRFGFDLHLLHDVHHRLTPTQAAALGKRLEESALFWLEDPVPAELQEGYRLIRQHTTTPIAVGEVFSSIWDCQQLITEQLIDFIRTSVTHAGGITHLRRIFALADLYHVRSGSHGATDLSPVSLAAAIHVGMSIPNFGLQEYMRHTPETESVFPHEYAFGDGSLLPGNAPGLGVDIDEALAARYPYSRAYLPVARLTDGTVHSW